MSFSMYPRFFITHSWRDNSFAEYLADDLRTTGLEGFFDVYSIHPGDNIPKAISEGLDSCSVYIPILSTAAFDSPWCEWELTTAIQLRNTRGRQGRPKIIPVVIDNCQRTIPAILRPIAYIDFVGNYDKSFEQLLVRGLGIQPGTLKKTGKKNIPGQARLPFMDTAFEPPPFTPSKTPLAIPLPLKPAARTRNAKLVLSLGGIVSIIAIAVLLMLFTGVFDETIVSPATLVSPIVKTVTSTLATRTPTPAPSMTAQASVRPSPSPSVAVVSPTPPVSIENPLCPDPKSDLITFPVNGSTISGSVQIRGTIAARGSAQPYRYSLFYRPGIVRDAMDGVADAQTPLSATQPNGKNIPIQVRYFAPYDGPIIDSTLGDWNTHGLASGWYSLRLWFKEQAGNYLTCDAYVYVK